MSSSLGWHQGEAASSLGLGQESSTWSHLVTWALAESKPLMTPPPPPLLLVLSHTGWPSSENGASAPFSTLLPARAV